MKGTTLPRGAKILPCRLTQSNSRDIFFSPNGDLTGTTGSCRMKFSNLKYEHYSYIGMTLQLIIFPKKERG